MREKKGLLTWIVETRVNSMRGVDAFARAGFSNSDIAVLLPGLRSAVTGLLTGCLAGGALSLLAGIRSLSASTVEAFLRADFISESLAGVTLAGAVGGCIGTLIALRLPEDASHFHEDRAPPCGALCPQNSAIARESEPPRVYRAASSDLSATDEIRPLTRADDGRPERGSNKGPGYDRMPSESH